MFSSLVAQDEPQPTQQPYTNFWATCIEALGETHYRIHIAYDGTGGETYNFSLSDTVVRSDGVEMPYSGTGFTNIPATFTTEAGLHDIYWLDLHSEDSMYTFTLNFAIDYGTGVLPVNTWTTTEWCNDGAYSTPTSPNATPEPTAIPPDGVWPTAAPEWQGAWAWVRDGATGLLYHSRISDTGLVLDLPPATR